MVPLSVSNALISALMAAALAASSAWKIQDFRYAAKERDRIKAEAAVIEANRKQTETASIALEADKQEIEIRYKTVVKTITKIVDRPVYSNVCLDEDGIAAINGGSK